MSNPLVFDILTMPDLSHEMLHGFAQGRVICGVDEVGRGPLAGPVIAAAAVLPHGGLPADLAAKINDSKQLSETKREALFPLLTASCLFAIGEASVEEIDRLNILQASLLAMTRAVNELTSMPDLALIDGNKAPRLSCPAVTIVKGDSQSLSIAAASIIAKVTRDRLMKRLAQEHPGYGWERNAGYGTAAHLKALREQGLTPWHRRSFGPVARLKR